MSGAIKALTPTYGFRLINFDFPSWGDTEHANWKIADAILSTVGALGVSGTWENAVAYVAGNRVVDIDNNTVYLCEVSHTSATTGTFLADRTANLTYWSAVSSLPVWRSTWATTTVYNTGDIIVTNTYDYYFCTVAHTSGATFAGDSANWQLIFQGSTTVTAAELAKTNAETAETNAAASAIAAAADAVSTNADAIATAADRVQTGLDVIATAADKVATNADVVLTNADAIATAADRVQTGLDVIAAAASASSAAASYDSFDDRYLGAKASDPTLDNDGNALLTGAIYFNTATDRMKQYTGAVWTNVTNTSLGELTDVDLATVAPVSGDGLVFDGTTWEPGPAGGGMFKGNNGTVGSRVGDIFRVNAQSLTEDTTIAATENASAAGPLSVASGKTLTISSGGSLVIL